MSNPFTDELVTYVYRNYLNKVYGMGKQISLTQEEQETLRLRFMITTKNLYKLELSN